MNMEAKAPGSGGDGGRDRLVAHLRRRTAAAADQELMRVGMGMGMAVARLLRTADKGVQPLDLMDKPLFHQKIQRPIHGRRRRAAPFPAQPVQQRIGADRLHRIENQSQHLSPQLRQLGPTGRAGRRGPIQAGLDIACGRRVMRVFRHAHSPSQGRLSAAAAVI